MPTGKTRLKFQPLAAAAAVRPSARNYEALSKNRYNSVRISNFDLKFLHYILNILYFRLQQKKIFDFFNPSYQTTTLSKIEVLTCWLCEKCIKIFKLVSNWRYSIEGERLTWQRPLLFEKSNNNRKKCLNCVNKRYGDFINLLKLWLHKSLS